ncbi:MAG TPA: cation:proton antiporter [Candidatus Xenobia bacterium]|jgi:Kef-type K+ transport system membrane component KefB
MLEPVVVHLVVELVALIVTGHVLGELARRFSQPPVLGQLLAGILLGPSILGQASPTLETALFPPIDVLNTVLEGMAWLGVVFLLTLTGLETDTELIKRQWHSAFAASVLGIALPFASGLGLGYVVPNDWLVSPQSRLALSLFLATALSISALPVVARILMDMNLMRRNIGQTILAAALVNDTLGWLILGFVASLFDGQSQGGPLLRAVFGTGLYALLLFTVGRRLAFAWLRWIHERLRHEEVLLAAIFVLVFISAGIAQALGTHALLGAFLMGMALRQSLEVSHLIIDRIEGFTLSFLAPIFFAAAGLRVVAPHLADGAHLAFFVSLVVLACVGKIVGCYIGGRYGRLPHWEALALGFGMNARGATSCAGRCST